MRRFMLAVVFAGLAAGCAGEVGYTATVSNEGYAYGPDLVDVSPGVQVIADWNEPIFFVDGLYWRFYGGGWYSSSYYTGGWVFATPPPILVRVGPPMRYAHYRPAGWQPRVRDHRRPPAPPPVIVRDHRGDRWREQPRPHGFVAPGRVMPPPGPRPAPMPPRPGPRTRPVPRTAPPPIAPSRDNRDRDRRHDRERRP